MFEKSISWITGMLTRSGSAENPANNIYDDETIDMLTAGGKFPKYGAIWKACSLIANGCAKLPVDMFEKTEKGREKQFNPLVNLLKYQPNDYQTAYYYKQNMLFCAAWHGNAYAFIKRDKSMRITGFVQLDSLATYPVRENNKIWYVTTVNNTMLKFHPWEIIHIRGMGDDLVGWSVKDLASVAFDAAAMAQKYSRNFFKNSARPSVYITHPATLTEEAVARLKKQWNSMHAGVDNAHKTAILEEGAKPEAFSASAKDAMLIEAMQFSIVDVANWFNLPADRLNANINTSYKSLEQQNQNFLADSLDPWLVAWEQQLHMKCLTEAQKESGKFYFEFNRAALLRADLKTRGEYYNKALGGAPWMTINEVRGIENLNNIPEGENITFPTNNFTPDDDTDVDDTARAAKTAVEHVVERLKKRVAKDAKCTPANLDERHGEIINRELFPVCTVYHKLTGKNILTEAKNQINEVLS